MSQSPLPTPPQRPSRAVRNFALCAIALAALALSGRLVMNQMGSMPARHVIIVSMDTTRPDHFGLYGNPWIQTPFLDAIAQEGLILADYMNAANTTLASHTSAFTGKYPHRHGVPRNGFVVHADNVMLTETLKAAGFHTAGFLGSFALDARFAFNQGFDHYDQQFDVQVGDGGADQNQRNAKKVTDAVLAYLDGMRLPRRLFLFAHYFDPHMPYDPPAPFDGLYSLNQGDQIRMAPHPAIDSDSRAVDPRISRQLELYAGEISFMDKQIGRLLEELRKRGILDESVLVIINDHGENLGEHWGPPFDHGFGAYQSEARGFGVLRLPHGRLPGRKLTTPTSNVDLTPTILKFLGLATPAGLDGVAFDLTDPAPQHTPRTIFSEATKPWEAVEAGRKWPNHPKPRAVRDGPWKYIVTPYRRTEELFNLSSDPGERINLLPSAAPEVQQRLAELRAALKRFDADVNPPPMRFESSQRDETVRRLKALGYIDPGGATEPEEEVEVEVENPTRKAVPASKAAEPG